MNIDFQALTLTDCEEFEELTGVAFDQVHELLVSDRPKAKALKVLGWLCQRKVDPGFTLEQAGLDLPFVGGPIADATPLVEEPTSGS